jgi:hypothetical protein
MIRGEVAVFCSVLSVSMIFEELSSFPVLNRYVWGYRKSRHQDNLSNVLYSGFSPLSEHHRKGG